MKFRKLGNANMKTLKVFDSIKCLQDLLQSEEYQSFESCTLLNIQYHIINTDKNIDEMLLCNEHGLFGCTHGEFIECWRDFLETLKVWESKYDSPKEKENYDISKRSYNKILKDIRECEDYHIDHFTYNDVI